jgi:predicted nucleic acid-binding protein
MASRTATRSTTAPVFVDSNILVYAHDLDAGAKRSVAAALLERLWEAQTGALSIQVLQEFYVNVTRKIAQPVALAQAREILRQYSPWIRTDTSVATVLRASEISELARISFWGALVVASAEEAECTELATEDLAHGQVIAGVRIVNPFLGAR